MNRHRSDKRSFPQSAAVGWVLRGTLLVTLLWLLCWIIWGDSIAYLGYLNAAALIWGYASLITAAIFFWREEKGWGIFSFLLALSLMLPGAGLNIGNNAATDNARTAGTVRLVSASLRGRNDGPGGIRRAEQLLSYHPDVIAAQGVGNAKALHAAINAEAGQDWFMLMDGGLVLLSQKPMQIVSRNRLGSLLKARMDIDGKFIDVWTLRAPKDFVKPIENVRFFAELERQIITDPPDIILGDFNATWWNDGYRRVNKHMDNAHVSAGLGFGNSFPAPVRRLGLLGAYARIDHIFLGQSWQVTSAFTGEAATGQDHHPVIADIILSNAKPKN